MTWPVLALLAAAAVGVVFLTIMAGMARWLAVDDPVVDAEPKPQTLRQVVITNATKAGVSVAVLSATAIQATRAEAMSWELGILMAVLATMTCVGSGVVIYQAWKRSKV